MLCSFVGRPIVASPCAISGKALRSNVRPSTAYRLGFCPARRGTFWSWLHGADGWCCFAKQVQNGGRVFAAADTSRNRGHQPGAKTQIGRWKGLDEDISDDQVSWYWLQSFDTIHDVACRALS